MASEPLIVQALHPFKGSNNDELCFQRGDLITITQQDDEGWWEGTLNEKTGWFPSNYVQECKDAPKPTLTPPSEYKNMVLRDLIDSEKAHVTELEGLVQNFLQPLAQNTILSQDEYKQLTGNIEEVLEAHKTLQALIEAEFAKGGLEQKVGRLFLQWAPKIKKIHQMYCSLHPRAVVILDKYKDELAKYMESKGAATPGVLVLTTMLSKPFRRLEKYSGMLQELERHVEESHPDRGDTQRSVAIYKEIATKCLAIRRQKELELQVLTGPVRGWEGPTLTSLGDIIYMGSVAVGPQHHDRYLVLFPTTLVILSVSHRLSAFIYEGKLFVSGLMVTRLEDSAQFKNAFELAGPMIDKRVAVCQSAEEADRWVELLRKTMPRTSTASNQSQRTSPTQVQYVPQPPPHMSSPQQATKLNPRPPGPKSSGPLPPPHNFKSWSITALRPTPPLRPTLALTNQNQNHNNNTNSNHNNTTTATSIDSYVRYNNKPSDTAVDGLIFDVIETYYALAKPRNTVNSVSLSNGPRFGRHSDVGRLPPKLRDLDDRIDSLARRLQEERDARLVLQAVVKKYCPVNAKDFDDGEWQSVRMLLANHA